MRNSTDRRLRSKVTVAALAGLLGLGLMTSLAPSSAGASAVHHATEADTVAIPDQLSFGPTRVGDVSNTETITLDNQGSNTDTIAALNLGGADPDDFGGSTDCLTEDGDPLSLAPGASCSIEMQFTPGANGARSATVEVVHDGPPIAIGLSGTGTVGYYLATSTGGIYPFGDAQNYGDMSKANLNAPIVSVQASADGYGYYLLGGDGGIFSFGDAQFFGSTGALPLNAPVISMAPTIDGGGYWLVAGDGGIFSFGDAEFFGSTGSLPLNKPIVGMAETPDEGGYWLVASDGGIFAFGDAGFYGSTGALHLNKPIVGMEPTPDGGGYWLVASDGGIFAFGDAGFYGSTGSLDLVRPIVGMAASPDGLGYWLAASDGGIFNGGDAPFLGGLGGTGIENVIGIAGTAPPTLQAALDAPAARGRAGLARHPGWARLRA